MSFSVSPRSVTDAERMSLLPAWRCWGGQGLNGHRSDDLVDSGSGAADLVWEGFGASGFGVRGHGRRNAPKPRFLKTIATNRGRSGNKVHTQREKTSNTTNHLTRKICVERSLLGLKVTFRTGERGLLAPGPPETIRTRETFVGHQEKEPVTLPKTRPYQEAEEHGVGFLYQGPSGYRTAWRRVPLRRVCDRPVWGTLCTCKSV